MEERVAGGSNGKDKKYVLYTVVGDDRNRSSPGSLMIKILLGSLMIVALAVVPYVSLRIAQANSRTLVVFQPVPVRNHTSKHHLGSHKTSSGRSRTVNLMQVADLTLENYTVTANGSSLENGTHQLSSSEIGNATISPGVQVDVVSTNTSVLVTLQESDEAIAILDHKNVTESDVTKKPDISSETDKQKPVSPKKPTSSSTEQPLSSTIRASPNKISTTTSHEITSQETKIEVEKSSKDITSTTIKPTEPNLPATTTKNTKTTIQDTTPKTSTSTTKVVKQISSPSITKSLSHKLVYVATASSGNHVGGICVWKVDKNITDWSYFYDNIPIEFQSGHDTGDHELRANLAAVRSWSGFWQDAHVTLRSQHNAIEHSDLAVRKDLINELEKLSDEHFTYELEWRLPDADNLVKIASSLSRLHQDYNFWFQDFKNNVAELLGEQKWDQVLKQKHLKINEEAYFTDETSVEPAEKMAQPISTSEEVDSTTLKSKVKTPHSLSHKLVYVATSASGNHVGGFCMWKLDKNVTDWSYFYDNIPVEYQSNHDSADHEQRATLAAVRVWAGRWEDAHVTLRSQHAAVERSDSYLKKVLVENLDRLSENHFTYDLEWRLRKSDDLVKVSFSLSRLHRNFAHWFAVFKASVDDILGAQDWDSATKDKRVMLTDQDFYTEEKRPEVNQNSLDATLAELENSK